MSSHASSNKSKRRRLAPIALATGLLSAALLSLTLTGTMSGFVASITNSNDTAASGTLVMEEANAAGTVVCDSSTGNTVTTANTATCATINKFGGSTTMVPGTTVNTSITIKNIGTVTPATFTLAPGGVCTQTNATVHGSATDLCTQMKVKITSGATTVFDGTALALGAATATGFTMPTTAAAPGVLIPFTFAVTLPATVGNEYQGMQAAVPLTWTFAS